MRRNLVAMLTLAAALAVFGSVTHITDHLSQLSSLNTVRTSASPFALLESPVQAQVGWFQGIHRTFTTQTATGATTALTPRGIPTHHTAELIVTGAPTGCTYRLQGSRDGTTFFNISASDVTCTSTTVAFEANKPTVHIRGNLLTLTGGTSPSVTLKYVGR